MRRLFFSVFIFLIFFAPHGAFAYFPTTTHAGLSEQIVDFYNIAFDKNISAQQREWIARGSIDEDIPAVRALNHFYDPIYNRGINNLGTAKSWALDFISVNSYTWDKVIGYYARGEEQKAYKGFGHILHLIEDMGVPDHTRNDPHIGDGLNGLETGHSPYEDWAKIEKTRETLKGLARTLYTNGAKPYLFFTPDEYFDFLANYANKNFFSADTIESEEYTEPRILEINGKYGYSTDTLKSRKVKLVISRKEKGFRTFVLRTNNDTSVLSSYFDRLSGQIIPTGAGIMNLFFQEAETARAQYQAEQKARAEANIFIKIVYKAGDITVKPFASLLYGSAALTKVGVQASVGAFFSSQRVAEYTSSQNPLVPATLTTSPFASALVRSLTQSPEVQTDDTELNLADNPLLLVQPPAQEPVVEIETEIVQLDLVGDPPFVAPITPDIADTEIVQMELKGDSLSLPYPPGGAITGVSPDAILLASEELSTDADSATTSTSELSTDSTSSPQATLPLFVSGPMVDADLLSTSTARIFWNTDEPTIDVVAYGTTTAYGSTTPLTETASTSHHVLLGGLSASTTYYFSVSVFTDSGASTTSGGHVFTTLPIASTTAIAPPTLSTTTPTTTPAWNTYGAAPVVINEIAWRGTTDPTDEWIELFNTTGEDIDVTGWVLESYWLGSDGFVVKSIPFGTSTPHPCLVRCIIPAHGYFLLERTASTTTDQQEDMIYAGALKDSGGALRLKDSSGTTIDDTTRWHVALPSKAGKSMERVSPYAHAYNPYNWKVHDETLGAPFAKDANGKDIFGTPGAQNSVSGFYTPVLTTWDNTVWYKALSPYYVPTIMTVLASTTLTIEPGTVVKFATRVTPFSHRGGGLVVKGALNAQGTETDPIIFTSVADDASDGKDTDNETIAPAPRDWTGIAFTQSASSTISHARIRYAGNEFLSNPNGHPIFTGALEITDASPVIAHTIFDQNYLTAVYITGSTSYPTIASSTIARTTSGVRAGGYGIYIPDTQASARIIGNTFRDNLLAVKSKSSAPAPLIFTDNIFVDNQKNADFAGRLHWNLVARRNQDLNARGGISANFSLASTTAVLTADTMPYLFAHGFSVLDTASLTIEPGTVIKSALQSNWYRISGVLNARGTRENPIIFTSAHDNSDGYNSSHLAELPLPGQWRYIQFTETSASSSALEHVIIRYGGAGSNICPHAFFGGPCMLYEGAVFVDSASPTITDTLIDHTQGVGIAVQGTSTPRITHSTISNTVFGIRHPSDTRTGWGWGARIDQASTTPTSMMLLQNTFINNQGEDVLYRP